MALTSDKELFSIIEGGVSEKNIENVIIRSLMIKKSIVEQDEREGGIRKILNFGHTVGHAIEAHEGGRLYHGESVALGMIPMCSQEVRARLIAVLKSLSLPHAYSGDIEAASRLISHDKKRNGDYIDAIFVDEIGKYRIEKITAQELAKKARKEL